MELESLVSRALSEISAAESLDSLADVERAFIGKKGELTLQKKSLGGLEPDERRSAGQALNEALEMVSTTIGERRESIAAVAETAQLQSERLDLTESLSDIERGTTKIRTARTGETGHI